VVEALQTVERSKAGAVFARVRIVQSSVRLPFPCLAGHAPLKMEGATPQSAIAGGSPDGRVPHRLHSDGAPQTVEPLINGFGICSPSLIRGHSHDGHAAILYRRALARVAGAAVRLSPLSN
jgi:hypothetical protein